LISDTLHAFIGIQDVDKVITNTAHKIKWHIQWYWNWRNGGRCCSSILCTTV